MLLLLLACGRPPSDAVRVRVAPVDGACGPFDLTAEKAGVLGAMQGFPVSYAAGWDGEVVVTVWWTDGVETRAFASRRKGLVTRIGGLPGERAVTRAFAAAVDARLPPVDGAWRCP